MNSVTRLNQMCPAANAAKLGNELQFAASLGRVGTAGTKYFVDSVNGSDARDGTSWDAAFATIQSAVDVVDDYGWIFITGRFDEDVTTPAWASGAGATDVKIVGMDGTNGFYPNAPEWRGSNGTTGIPLIMRSVGWSVERIKFRVPTTNVAVKLRYRVDDSDAYDATSDNLAACCVIKNCWFYGGGTGYIGINLLGAPYCTQISDNYFELIVKSSTAKCITCTESSMASPFRTLITGNIFNECEGHIDFNAKGSNAGIIAGNIFQGSSHGGYSGKKCDMGAGGNDNTVVDNRFGGDYSIVGGYQAGTGDMWVGGNVAEDVAATSQVDASTGFVKAVPA